MTTPTPADALDVERLLALHHPLATLDPAVYRCCACEGGACVAHNDGRDTTEWPCDFERLRAAIEEPPVTPDLRHLRAAAQAVVDGLDIDQCPWCRWLGSTHKPTCPWPSFRVAVAESRP